MITYFRFLLLPLIEKKVYLQKKGTFLISYSHEQGIVNVYAIGDFFVEVYFNELKDTITEVIAFKSLQRLQHHAEHVDLALLSA